MQSGDSGYTGQRTLKMELPGKKRRGRLQRSSEYSEGGQRVGVTEGGFWQRDEIEMICCK